MPNAPEIGVRDPSRGTKNSVINLNQIVMRTTTSAHTDHRGQFPVLSEKKDHKGKIIVQEGTLAANRVILPKGRAVNVLVVRTTDERIALKNAKKDFKKHPVVLGVHSSNKLT